VHIKAPNLLLQKYEKAQEKKKKKEKRKKKKEKQNLLPLATKIPTYLFRAL
jgi:hypothetical protein